MKRLPIIVFLFWSILVHGQDIVQLEYFFDTDPGYGSATLLPITPDSLIEVEASLSLESLVVGLHTLYMRAKDTLGNWSFVQKQSFLKDLSQVASDKEVITAEYFFDNDPGLGNGIAMSFSKGADIFIIDQASLEALDNGIHTIYLRAMDVFGKWSFLQKRTFLKDIIQTPVSRDIVEAEYFFDTDPGYGNGITLPITFGSTVDILTELPLSTLSNGMHTVYFRVLDDLGVWSFIQKRTFIKDQYASGGPVDITEIEYFIDTDPGQGNAIALAGPDDTNITRDTLLNLNGLDCGIHTLFARAKNAADIWSLPQSRAFLFDDHRVEFAQFKFDSIPAFVDWTDSNPFSKDFDVIADIDFAGICDLDTGWYYIDSRVRRDKSWWSDTFTDSIRIKDFYDQTGQVSDQFDNIIAFADILVDGIGSFQTDATGQYAFAVTKCWGDSVTMWKDSAYTSDNSYFFQNPMLDYSPHHILGDIDTNLFAYKCVNLSGTIPTDLDYICKGTTYQVTNTGSFVDTGSLSGYILHDGVNTLGTIYDMRLSGSYTNDGSIPQNQKLYLSPVVGRPGQSDLFDVDHPCTDIMLPGMPVVFLNVKDSVFFSMDSAGTTVFINPDTLVTGPCTDCGIDTIYMTQTAFGCADRGFNSEFLTVDDGNGNTSGCEVIVAVSDFISPLISCRTDTTVSTTPGVCGYLAGNDVLEPLSTWDNCSFIVTNDLDGTSTLNGKLVPKGLNQITWTINDTQGNSADCSFSITVQDNEQPIISCPADITLEISPGSCDTAYVYNVPSSDNCPGETVSLVTGIGSGGPFPIGQFTEQYLVTDAVGNADSCFFQITVEQLIRQISDTICFGDSIFLEKAWRFLPGVFHDTLPNINGCDSIVITTLDTTTHCIWQGEVVYVDSSATGENTGFDWPNAFVDLQSALNVTSRYLNVLQVWCAAGTYFPTSGTHRSAAFVLVDTVFLMGGFNGTEVDSAERNSLLNPTILSGDIGIPGDLTDNSYHVVSFPDLGGTVIDGFIIENGFANGLFPVDQSGAGLQNFGELTIRNLTFRNCSSSGFGAYIHNDGPSALLKLQNTAIMGAGTQFVLNSGTAIMHFVGTSELKQE